MTRWLVLSNFSKVSIYWLKGEGNMQKYVCGVCGYVYDPAEGDPESSIPPGVPFEKLPEDWACPICGAGKDEFSPE